MTAVDAWKSAPWPGRPINPDDSVATIDLEACNPETLPEAFARHGITGHECEPATYWWPIWRYTGTLTALSEFLAEQYDDGSGEGSWALLARTLYGRQV